MTTVKFNVPFLITTIMNVSTIFFTSTAWINLFLLMSFLVSITTAATVEWIKFNKNQVGYYRVNYPTDMWQSFSTVLLESRGVFSVADRAHLINDVFILADAGQVDYSIALDLSQYLENELDYVPWSVAASHLSAIKNLLYFTDLYRDFVDHARQLLKGAYESVTWDVGDDHLQK